MNSILNSVKKMLGIAADYDIFDPELIIHINSVFATLHQLGVGPTEVFSIQDDTAIWDDFIQNEEVINSVRTYVYLKVRNIFDPPTSSFVLEAYNKQAEELEWRMNVAADHSKRLE